VVLSCLIEEKQQRFSKVMAKKGRQLPGSKTKTELELFSPKDRSKVFKKPKKGDDIKKEIEDNKMEFDPSFRITKVDPEKRTIKGFKIGKKGAEFYFEKKFKKGGRVCRIKPKLAKRGYK
jgi:hypothetical protein